jgi:hypothetical protein
LRSCVFAVSQSMKDSFPSSTRAALWRIMHRCRLCAVGVQIRLFFSRGGGTRRMAKS